MTARVSGAWQWRYFGSSGILIIVSYGLAKRGHDGCLLEQKLERANENWMAIYFCRDNCRTTIGRHGRAVGCRASGW